MADIKQNGMMVHIICKEYGYMPEPDHLIKIIHQRWKATLTNLEITVAEKYADKFLNKGVIYTRRRVRENSRVYPRHRRPNRSKELLATIKERYYNILMTVPQSEWGDFAQLLYRIQNTEPKLECIKTYGLSWLHKQMANDPQYPGIPLNIKKDVFMPELAKKKRSALVAILARYEGRPRPLYRQIVKIAREEFGAIINDEYIREYFREINPNQKLYERGEAKILNEVLVDEPVPF